MVTIHANLNNFFHVPILKEIFSGLPEEYEFTRRGIIWRKHPPACSCCRRPMLRNGYNRYTKKALGIIKIGRWLCKDCN